MRGKKVCRVQVSETFMEIIHLIKPFLSRTEIDLKGHRLAQHSGALSKVGKFLHVLSRCSFVLAR